MSNHSNTIRTRRQCKSFAKELQTTERPLFFTQEEQEIINANLPKVLKIEGVDESLPCEWVCIMDHPLIGKPIYTNDPDFYLDQNTNLRLHWRIAARAYLPTSFLQIYFQIKNAEYL